MSPNTALPPDAQETPTSQSPLQKLSANKNLFVGIIAILVVVLVAYGAIAMMQRSATKTDDRAWSAFYDAMMQLQERAQKDGVFFSLGTAEFHQALDADFQTRVFRDVVESVRGTSAEPAALFYLGNSYLVGRKLDLAQQTFDELKQNHGDHYLVNADKTYLSQTLVDQAMNTVKNEKAWLDNHPNFLTGVKKDEPSEEDGSGSNDAESDDEG